MALETLACFSTIWPRFTPASDQNVCGPCLEILDALPTFFKYLEELRRLRTTSANPGDPPSGVGNVELSELGDRLQKQPIHDCLLCRLLWKLRNKILIPEDGASSNESLWACPFLERWEGPHTPQSVRSATCLDFLILVVVVGPQEPVVLDRFSHKVFDKVPFYDIPTVALFDAASYFSLLYWPRSLPELFDTKVALEWLHACKTHHDSCKTSPGQHTEIDLIDCKTRMVTKLDMTHPYIALSYVWGSAVPAPLNNGIEIPVNTSAVILDAIHLTQKLGFRYLWVDQYCINQENLDIRARQIEEMSHVYSQAELTIVAAAGTDAGYGIPGVRDRPRNSPPTSITTGQHAIVDLGPDARSDLISSKWSTRGWTFQEAWLSKRLLCFTDTQCYFECEHITCAESLQLADGLWTCDSSIDNSSHLDFGPYSRFQQTKHLTSPVHQIDTIQTLLQSYSKRELSFDEDTLNAITGLLAVSEVIHLEADYELEEPLHFTAILGIPLIVGDLFGTSMMEQTLVSGLSWFHSRANQKDIGLPLHPSRRACFPSWTWAGWKGVIEHCWLGLTFVSFDSVIQDARVTTIQLSPQGAETCVQISDVTPLTRASTLSFDALQLPHEWLAFSTLDNSHTQWHLCDSAVDLYNSETIWPADFMGSLKANEHFLVLIGYTSEEKEGLVWILRKLGLDFTRVGVIKIGPVDALPDTADSDASQGTDDEKLSNALMSHIGNAPLRLWNIV